MAPPKTVYYRINGYEIVNSAAVHGILVVLKFYSQKHTRQ